MIQIPPYACPAGFWFFFSSRRRHTRWTGDWSSDVCSSDLFDFVNMKPDSSLIKSGAPEKGSVRALAQPGRSEERRVGKECRSWWGPYHQKKKRQSSLEARAT